MKYKLIDRTPEELRCGLGLCPAIYEIKDLTPKEMQCIIGGCPAIYDVEELTPKEMNCAAALCPAIFDYTPKEMNCAAVACPSIHGSEENYLIIGTKVNPADFGLEKKVGENEVLVQVPKKLIDKMEE